MNTINTVIEKRRVALPELEQAYRAVIEQIGDDPIRQGVIKTPQRAAKAILFFTKGYEENLTGIK